MSRDIQKAMRVYWRLQRAYAARELRRKGMGEQDALYMCGLLRPRYPVPATIETMPILTSFGFDWLVTEID